MYNVETLLLRVGLSVAPAARYRHPVNELFVVLLNLGLVPAVLNALHTKGGNSLRHHLVPDEKNITTLDNVALVTFHGLILLRQVNANALARHIKRIPPALLTHRHKQTFAEVTSADGAMSATHNLKPFKRFCRC